MLAAVLGVVSLVGAVSSTAEAQVGRSRLRLGLQGDVGGIQNTDAGFGVGMTGQLGIQHNRLFATYYQPRFFAGGYVDGNSSGGIVAIYNTFMFNLTFANVFEIGLGPSLDLGVANVCPERRSNGNCDGFGGVFFGSDFRLAVVIGGGRDDRRGGFVIAFHSHPTWIGNHSIATFTLGFGFQFY